MDAASGSIFRRYRVSSSSLALDELAVVRDGGDRYDLDPPYQRGAVWGARRKKNLIKSVLMGVPIPAIVVNDRFAAGFSHPGYSQDRNWMNAVVDGKQRMTALREYVTDCYAVPARWFGLEADLGEVLYSQLPARSQRLFLNTPISISRGQFTTLDEERELFDLLNFGGLAQGEKDEDA